MGNSQSGSRRERSDMSFDSSHDFSRGFLGSSSHRHRQGSSSEDSCPVQLKLQKRLTTDRQSSQTSMEVDSVNRYPVVLKWKGTGKNVAVSGSWNAWKTKIPLVKSHSDFITIMNLPEGRHEFKFFIDGQWLCDNSLSKTGNSLGTENNVTVVDKGDYELFDALDRDLAECMSPNSTMSKSAFEMPTQFTQEIPDKKSFEFAQHPPALPPHLLQVILNRDIPDSVDPNMLPEPNHVMLNHLYALSIKEGIMVLSATHRYRKKYCTSVMYKPIAAVSPPRAPAGQSS